MGPDSVEAAPVVSQGQDNPLPATTNNEDDEFEELFGVGTGGLAGAQEEEDVALQQLNRLERVVAGDAAGAKGGCTELVGGAEWSAIDAGVLGMARLLKGGKFLDVLEGSRPWLLSQPSGNETGGHVADVIGARVVAFVCGEGDTDENALLWRAATALWVGVAALNLYLQANYTGPAVEATAAVKALSEAVRAMMGPRWDLECDGEVPYGKSEMPELLSLARAVLHPLSLPESMPWSTAVQLSKEGKALLAPRQPPLPPTFRKAVSCLHTAKLWAGRGVVTHRRLFSGRHATPGLWAEAQALFLPLVKPDGSGSSPDTWATRVWLEWGLAQHHMDEGNRGKDAFKQAVAASGLELTLTAAMGKRTKFQQKELAQMVLLVKPARADGDGTATTTTTPTPLPSAAVHPTDSVRLETVSYTDPSLAESPPPEQQLTPLEQSAILALCLDIANNNPKDGLTTEEMVPYIERVLQTPANWMVYSTGLLERSWLDFESPYGRERAVLQLQALVDQHGTRLTLTQASTDVVADSAPAQERLEYVHCIAYPPQWELKRGLADRYAKLGVYGSAAEMYLELEQWDELVQCYRALDRMARAEAVVRERLEVDETPAMWTALGDLTQDAECYVKAWELSKGRYARAKRSLGRMAFRNKNLEEALGHFEQAVAIMPLVPDTWFLMGLAYMSLERWEEATKAFTRVVQQEPDDGRAWGNLGAIHTKAGDFERALAAFKEGVRHQRDSAHMWENYLICSAKLEQYYDVITAYQRLLDIRQQHVASGGGKRWEVDVEVLDFLVHRTAVDPRPTTAEVDDGPARALLQKRVAELLGRASSVASTDSRLWSVYATFNEALGRWDQALDCRTKACRALVNRGQWEKEAGSVKSVVEAIEALGTAYLRQPTMAGLQQCLWFLRSPLQRLSVEPWEGGEEQLRVKAVLQSIDEGMARLKEQQAATSTGTA